MRLGMSEKYPLVNLPFVNKFVNKAIDGKGDSDRHMISIFEIALSYKGKTYDVKAMIRKVDVKDSYTNNFPKLQENYNVDGYIFCSINRIKNELTVCGWIRKENWIKNRKLCKKGSDTYRDDGSSFPVKSDNYEIDNKYLNFVNSIADMKMQMISRWDKNSPFYE